MNISLIIPCYNEETNIQKGVLDKIGNFVKENDLFSEVVIVDDGSTDQSKKIIKDVYLSKFSKFKLVENNHQGKAYAIITGIKQAKADHVMFSDIDLATPIEEADKLISEAKKGNEIVIGSRSRNRTGAPILRRVMAVGFIFIRDVLINLRGIRDTQCGFKLFDKERALNIIEKLDVYGKQKAVQGSSVSAGFDLEFLFLASKMGLSIKEVPVTWRHVETKNVNFLRDSVETLGDIVKIKLLDLQGKYV
jgi:glycosyltransferase involved in cell wall biosynthesis